MRVIVNDDAPIDVDLGAASHIGAGQVIQFPAASIANLRIEVLAAAPTLAAPEDPARVGLAEIGLGDVRITEVVRPPIDLDTVNQPFAPHPYVIVAPPGHPLVGKKKVSLATLMREPFVVREKGSDTWNSLGMKPAWPGRRARCSKCCPATATVWRC